MVLRGIKSFFIPLICFTCMVSTGFASWVFMDQQTYVANFSSLPIYITDMKSNIGDIVVNNVKNYEKPYELIFEIGDGEALEDINQGISLSNDIEYKFYNSEAREQLQPLVQRNTPNKLFIATATIWNSELTKQPYLWLRNCIDVFDSENAAMQSLELYESDKTGKLRSFTNNLLKEADINISDFTVESREIKNAPPLFLANYPAVQKEYKVMAMHTIKSINKDVSQKYLLPMQSESKGTQNLFFLSPWISRALDNGYVFCVDELDASMHPSLLLYIVNLFNSPKTNPHGAQLIMTTHTTDLLSSSIMRRDQILFIEKDNDTGLSDLYSLNDFPARTREDFRKAYIAGRYGAIPNIL